MKIKELFKIFDLKRTELNLFIPMIMLVLCILYNFSSLRILRDSIVISQIGAEAVSFLKIWFIVPCAFLFTIIFTYISNYLSTEKLFYIFASLFIIFFAIFAYILYPNHEILRLNNVIITNYIHSYPNFKWFFLVAKNWHFSLFFIITELWSPIMLNLFFWQFANHITSIENAKRFYPLYGLIGNFAVIFAGEFTRFLIHFRNDLLIEYSITLTIVITFISMLIYRWLNLKFGNNNISTKFTIKHKTNISMLDNLKLICKSQNLYLIFILVLCYGLSTTVIEGPWHEEIRKLYPSQNEYAKYYSKFVELTGIASVIFTIIGSYIIRKYSWRSSAIITPIVFLIGGGIFFTSIILRTNNFSVDNLLYIAVIAGGINYVMSKAAKYTLFDATKEMAFIPLSEENKTNGKAVVEIIGTRVSASSGYLIQSLCFIIFPASTYDSIMPILAVTFFVTIIIWIRTVNALAKINKFENNNK